jgi:hypothetical protein
VFFSFCDDFHGTLEIFFGYLNGSASSFLHIYIPRFFVYTHRGEGTQKICCRHDVWEMDMSDRDTA